MRLRATVIAALLPLAFALGACGGATTTTVTSAPAGSTSTSSSSSSTTTPATSSSTTASSTTTGTGTTTSGGPPPCVAADLAPSFLGQQGATGHGLLGFALKNKGDISCKTFGYPGIQFLDKAGNALPTVPTHTTHDFFGQAPEVELVLAPGQSASFRVGVLHGAVPNEPCATAAALQIIAPDDTATMQTVIPGGAYECKTATVSPLRPGTSAYP